ncbi:hypothetical protein JR334_05510 [Clostridia bacterium]|nr:hypothetical protein JR334_05510 [Clostridia bacterium]
MKKFAGVLIIAMLLLTACSAEEPVNSETDFFEETATENSTVSEELQSFGDVYDGDLIETLDYFNDHYEQLEDNQIKDFSENIVAEYTALCEKPINGILIGDCPEPETAYIPMSPVLDDGLYDFYDFSTSEFNLAFFKDQPYNYEYFQKIAESDLFTICMGIYADSGFLQPEGFRAIVKPDVFEKFQLVIASLENENSEIPYLPNMEYDGVDSVINSTVSYPQVLMHNFEEVLELKDEDTWKTYVFLPVQFVENEIETANHKDVFHYAELTSGTQVSDKFKVELFENGAMGMESLKYRLLGNGFLKGNLFGDSEGQIHATFAENYFDKNVMLKNDFYDNGEEEADLNTNNHFAVDREMLQLPVEYISYLENEGEITCEMYVKELEFENDPVETISIAHITEVKISDAEINRVNNEITKMGMLDSTTTNDDSSSLFENETLYSEGNDFYIDYSKYATVIIPMQESINSDTLTPRIINVTNTGNEVPLMFSILGDAISIELSYIENGMEDSQKPVETTIDGPIGNECFILGAALPNDTSFVRVTVLYIDGSGVESTTFTLDDMRDPSAYKIFTINKM